MYVSMGVGEMYVRVGVKGFGVYVRVGVKGFGVVCKTMCIKRGSFVYFNFDILWSC